MTDRCASCNRRLYTVDTWPVADYAVGPFQSFGVRESAAMHRDWGWQSEWVPSLCRNCDTQHDHRAVPNVWQRAKRRLFGVQL
jgi:hypothetical protein